MNIIGGCSWACGEWGLDGDHDGPIHPGLEYNFVQDGIECINLAIPAESNLAAARAIEGYIERYPDQKIAEIYFFQTEWTRDKKYFYADDYENIVAATDLQNKIISRFYYRLAHISKVTNAKVYLIGGVSDTLWLTNMEKEYPGVSVLCQSLVNLLLNDNHRTNDPVFSWYTNGEINATLDLVKQLKNILSSDETKILFDMIDQGIARENLVFQHPEFFWPDGHHPNRHAYAKLYEFIKKAR